MKQALSTYILQGLIVLHRSDDDEDRRIFELLERYRDRPMDLADASLVAAAERLNDPIILTQDQDFYIYRFQDNKSFQIVP